MGVILTAGGNQSGPVKDQGGLHQLGEVAGLDGIRVFELLAITVEDDRVAVPQIGGLAIERS